MSNTAHSRRAFLKQTTMAGIVAAAFSPDNNMAAPNSAKQSQLTILFQGDSITDGNRGRTPDPNHILGHGYAFSIASRAGASFPEKANVFYNRGISGNKITDLEKRWQTDTLDVQPDVLSILIGVNDANSVVRGQDVVSVEKYEEVYRSLLTRTLSQFPDCLLVLCEPFIMPVGRVKDSWDTWNNDVQKRQAVVSAVAKDFNAVFVPLQKIFNYAVSSAPAEYWIWDGIHPTYSGHELITRQWLKQVSARLHFLRKIHF